MNLDKIKQYMYYFIIGIVSFISLVFLPMLGSKMGLGWNIPDTIVGWIVWVSTKVLISIINVLIFHSFMQQGKLNVKNNPRYIEAQDILRTIKFKNYIPKSPKEWNKKQYGIKGITIFIFTCLSTIALSQALLSYDWVTMLSYLLTIILGLIFGVLQMKTAEEYWTDEFWKYAKMIEAEYKQNKVLKSDINICLKNFENNIKELL